MRKLWHKKVLSVLQRPAIAFGGAATSLLGATAHADQAETTWNQNTIDTDPLILTNTLNATASDRYAAHSSHRSHGSHRSHRSSSGSGGAARPNSPQTTPTPNPETPTETTPSPPKPAPAEISRMAIRVQAALMRLGYFKSDIDGILGPATREAIKGFQNISGVRE